METLQELTGKESGVISYDGGDTWIRLNWASQYVPALPYSLGPLVVWKGTTWEAEPCNDPDMITLATEVINECERDDGCPERNLSPASTVRVWELVSEDEKIVHVATSRRWI